MACSLGELSILKLPNFSSSKMPNNHLPPQRGIELVTRSTLPREAHTLLSARNLSRPFTWLTSPLLSGHGSGLTQKKAFRFFLSTRLHPPTLGSHRVSWFPSLRVLVVIFFFKGLHVEHIEAPRPGVKLQLLAYSTPDP